MDNAPPRILIIGSYWSLALLKAIIATHHLQIDWMISSPTCYFENLCPITAESLSCLGQRAYGLPLMRSPYAPSGLWSLWPHTLIIDNRPSLQSLQEVWPHILGFPQAQRYQLAPEALFKGQCTLTLWSEARMHWTEDGLSLDTKIYDGIVVIGPHTEIWERIMQQARIPINNLSPKIQEIYCSKEAVGRFFLHKRALIGRDNIRWTLWEEGGWHENWIEKSAVALWAIETPFYIEKFLNQKKLFESFMKKISFHARQRGIRVR